MSAKYYIPALQKHGIQFLTVLLFAAVILSCQGPFKDQHIGMEIICDVDSSELIDGKKFEFRDGLLNFHEMNLGGYLSSEESHSGRHSVLLTGKKVFGLSTEFKGAVNDKYYRISVWRKDPSGKSVLVIEGDQAHSLYKAIKNSSTIDENGWEKLEIDLQIPPNISSFKVYVWKIDADSAFFDDLTIQEVGPKVYPAYENNSKLHLYFSDSKMKKFEEKRNHAFNEGVHFTDGEWMKGVMSDESNVMPIKARLKGDWLDHFAGQKWSFRIKMRDDFTFNRMRVFSLQNPITRNYLHEYIAHELFDQEDVLTTRYGFIPVYRNGVSLGIYAWEEHFAKQLLEYNLRREGPIVKFDENPLWREHQHLVLSGKWINMPYFETSRILAFGMGKTLEKENLRKQYMIAQRLMLQYKERKGSVTEIFNTEALAKYWALIDITNGRHGLAWHNQRMYYNPVLCKLEPINFDNYTDHYDHEEGAIVTALLLDKDHINTPEYQLTYFSFSSNKVLEKYIQYLEEYSQDLFLQQFLDKQTKEVDLFESLIQEENSEYRFNSDYLFENAAHVREALPRLKERFQRGDYDGFELQSTKKIADTSDLPLFYSSYVNTYYTREDLNKAHVLLENYTGRSIQAIGIADENNRMLDVFDGDISLKPFVEQVNDTSFTSKYFENAAQLVFRVEGNEGLVYSELSLWKKELGLSPYQEILKDFDLSSCKLFESRGDSLVIRGKHQLSEKVLVPSDKVVVFEAGAEVDMIQQAAFISHSPIYMMGTEKHPIVISSSDSSANAITVLQAQGKSELKHVVFSHLNTLDYKGWVLTGAVNFYESDVLISDCSIENNHCEDALNIIRSDFHVTRSHFKHIFADAFDSDFCTGMLDYTSFEYVGNDAIDFSTSQIQIEYCEINNINDKGISGGEGSTLWVKNTNISHCNIGAASKDLSMVELVDVNIANCYYGLVALKKKPEYGAATFQSDKLTISNCAVNHLIEKKSVLSLNGRRIEGTEEKVADRFY